MPGKFKKQTDEFIIDVNGNILFKPEYYYESFYKGNDEIASDFVYLEHEDLQRHNKVITEELFLTEEFPTKFKEIKTKSPDTVLNSHANFEWFIPDDYKEMDIVQHLWDLFEKKYEKEPKEYYCIAKERLEKEIKWFTEHNRLDLLKALAWLVDHMEKHNIVWGIGRGSSVSSFALYLLKVHRINPLKYGIDFEV